MNRPCHLSVQRAEDGYLIRLVGHGTREQSPALQEFAEQALKENHQVFVDLSECEYLDSTFLGCMAILARESKEQHQQFSVIATEAVRRKVFGYSQLDRIIPHVEEAPELVGEVVSLPATTMERQAFGRHVMETHAELAKLGGPSAAVFKAIAAQLCSELKSVDSVPASKADSE